MPTLRDLVDGNAICAAGPTAGFMSPTTPSPMGSSQTSIGKPSKKAGKNGAGKQSLSPLAQHVADHLGDAHGATKEGFTDLTQKKLEYDMARENMQRELAPVQSTIDHIAQTHGIAPGMGTPGMTPANQPGIDPNGPMGTAPGQDPNQPGMNDDPEMDEQGNPLNMGQTVGRMAQNRPSLAGHQPGVSPGPAESVRPPKMGMPKPGGLGARMPQPGVQQVNKQAAPPKGNKSLPGAKGPGDKKVGDKAKKAQSDSSRQIKIHVAAASIPTMKASSTIDTQFGIARLGIGNSIPVGTVMAGGPGSGRHKGGGYDQAHALVTKAGFRFKGTDTGYDARDRQVQRNVYTHPEYHTKLAVEPSGAFNHGDSGAGTLRTLPSHLKSISYDMEAGSSHGSRKGWSTRGKGHLGKKEKRAHYETMDSHGVGKSLSEGSGVPALSSGATGSPAVGRSAPQGQNRAEIPSAANKSVARSGIRQGGGMGNKPLTTQNTALEAEEGVRLEARKKKMKAGPSALTDKSDNPEHEVAYNPKYAASGMKCMKCGKVHARGAKCKG